VRPDAAGDDDGRIEAPYGAWASPLPIERLVEGVVFLAEPRARDGVRWWLEGRPDEGGRQVLVRRDPDGTVTRLTPPGFNARTRVHEYGGGATLVAEDLVVVSDFATGRLHRVIAPEVLEALTPDRAWRFADLTWDPVWRRILAVREDHEPTTLERHGEAENALVAIDPASGEVTVLVEGADFYAAPRPSPDGRHLAWLEWRHPNLPWDGTELFVAEQAFDGILGERGLIAGSPTDWIAQPRWSPDGVLHFVAEPSGFMQLQRWHAGGDGEPGPVAPLVAPEAEFAQPDWLFGNHTFDVLPDGGLVAVARSGGRDRLLRIAPDGSAATLDLPYTEILALAVDGWTAVLRAAGPVEPTALVEVDLRTSERRVLRRGTPTQPDPADVSVPRHVEFPTSGGRTAHGNLFLPHNRRFRAPEGERPPLIVTSHGGPTSCAFAAYTTTVQLFTSRGYAVLDVDYGGSTGYGREYRKRLEGEWGIVDVDDCVAGAAWLAAQGLVDGTRMAVRGGSASGFTTLAALAFREVFAAGTTYFGIGDLRAFVKDTHKFESRYLESLVGPWPADEQRYLQRSPSLHAERISAPVLVLQGADDRVVPPSEAERIVDALFERRIPHAYLLFPGEDHGFRAAPNIIRSFEAEHAFYGRIFGFTPADPLPPLEVAFLAEWSGGRPGGR
jgi:dipeptidyl aminopeptidase/acylaminoacyl peptidase